MIPVMLIEDEFLVRVGLKTCIPWEQLGYRITAEADGAEAALREFDARRPLLILTDIRLPHGSGIEVMREIRRKSKAVRFIIVTAYDDFNIAQQAIEIGVEGFFIKGNLNTEKLILLLTELRANCFSGQESEAGTRGGADVMSDIFRGKSSLWSEARMRELRAEGTSLFLLLFQAEEANIPDLSGMIQSFLRQRGVACEAFAEERRVWFFTAAKESSVRELAEQLQRMMSRYLSSDVRIGVSGSYFPRGNMGSTVLEALLAADHLRGSRGVTLEFYRERTGGRDKELVGRYEELLRAGQFRRADETLDELRGALCENYSVKSFQSAIYRLIGILTDYGVNPAVLRDIPELLDCETIFSRLRGCTLRLGTQENGESSDNAYVRLAQEYIRKHLDGPLKVSAVAKAVYVSPNYLGKIFLENTGEYLTDYISRSKIDLAKELLGERRHSMAEIAALVGVPDQRYFAKLFKKYSGLTPSEYANQAPRRAQP